MKALIATAAVVVALSIAMGSVAFCQEGSGSRNPELDAYRRKVEAEATQAERQKGEQWEAITLLKDTAWPGQGDSVWSRTVVVPAGELETADLDAILEDMNVMSRILDKALSGKLGEDYASPPPGRLVAALTGSAGAQGIYLEGYGALFMLQVKFPLLPPPAPQAAKPEPEEKSVWEETKRELYEPWRVRPILPGGPGMRADRVTIRSREYDAQKVENLKGALFEALKEAGHIRKLKPDDFVVLVVSGGGGPAVRVAVRGGVILAPGPGGLLRPTLGPPGMTPGISSLGGTSLGGQATLLTIRAKKSDVDAFAQDKVSLPEFQKRARVLTYEVGAGRLQEPGAERRRGVVDY